MLSDALKKIYESNSNISGNVLLGNLLDLCYDSFENKKYAMLYYKVNKEFDMYSIVELNGVEHGIE